MDLDTLAKLGEFIGGIFVVVSLAYVAYQVRQNTESLRTENYGRVLERMSTLQSRLSCDQELNRVVVRGSQHPGRLTAVERIRFSWAMYELFGAAEFMYHQAQRKALPDAVWNRWQASLVWWLSNPGVRSWWVAKPAPLSVDFEAFTEKLVRDRPADAEAARRWEAFVAGAPLGLEVSGEATATDPVASPGLPGR